MTKPAKTTHTPPNHPALPKQKIGVIICNLGTPEATDYWSMRRYLNQFLSDRRVIDYSPFLWQPLLQTVILTTRPSKSGAAYRSIWNTQADESPLLTITKDQTHAIKTRLAKLYGDKIITDFAMRYGSPAIKTVIKQMKAQGADKILFFPLYPQYAGATTATANDEAFRALMTMPHAPAIRTVPPYFDRPNYIDALAGTVREHYAGLDYTPVLVASYHGLPKRYLTQKGDPYHCHCQKTSRLLREKLGFEDGQIVTSFQSKFGPEDWLEPSTVDCVADLARAGQRKIAVIAPAFSADCIETLEEINEEIRDSFIHAGGTDFTYIPCLNAQKSHIDVLCDIIQTELAGWV